MEALPATESWDKPSRHTRQTKTSIGRNLGRQWPKPKPCVVPCTNDTWRHLLPIMSIPESKTAYFSPDNIEREVGSYLVSKQKLGEGGTAVVKLAWNRQRKELAAAKLIAKYRLTDRGRDNLEREYVS